MRVWRNIGSLALLLVLVGSAARAQGRPTHVVRATLVEVAATRDSGDPWDTGIGAFARPDVQVTLLRRDPQAMAAATEKLVAAVERRLKEAGQPLPPQFRETYARAALQTLRCGAAVAALQDAALNETRSRFAADTAVASDAFLSRPKGGELPVRVGDTVAVYVNDVDLAAHDLMGESELEITKELLRDRVAELKFGGVKLLRLELVPLDK